MKHLKLLSVLLLICGSAYSQTKTGGYVQYTKNEPVAYANVICKGSSEGTIPNENGRFYIESKKTWDTITVSFLGYKTREISLKNRIDFNLNIILEEETEQLDAVVIATGKQPKKNNPAIDILR